MTANEICRVKLLDALTDLKAAHAAVCAGDVDRAEQLLVGGGKSVAAAHSILGEVRREALEKTQP